MTINVLMRVFSVARSYNSKCMPRCTRSHFLNSVFNFVNFFLHILWLFSVGTESALTLIDRQKLHCWLDKLRYNYSKGTKRIVVVARIIPFRVDAFFIIHFLSESRRRFCKIQQCSRTAPF